MKNAKKEKSSYVVPFFENRYNSISGLCRPLTPEEVETLSPENQEIEGFIEGKETGGDGTKLSMCDEELNIYPDGYIKGYNEGVTEACAEYDEWCDETSEDELN